MGGEKVVLTTEDQKRLERATMASTEKLYDLDATPAEMPGLEDVALAIKRAQLGDRAELSKDGPWREHELKPAQRVLDLFAKILAEKERLERERDEARADADTAADGAKFQRQRRLEVEARALAAEAALAGALEALAPFADEKNGVVQDLLWGDQPDSATMTVTCPLGQVRKAREVVRAAAIRAGE